MIVRASGFARERYDGDSGLGAMGLRLYHLGADRRLHGPCCGVANVFPITQKGYENCVAAVMTDRQRNIALCVEQHLAEDLEKSRLELPVLPSRAEHEASCRYIWRDTPPNDCKPPKNSN